MALDYKLIGDFAKTQQPSSYGMGDEIASRIGVNADNQTKLNTLSDYDKQKSILAKHLTNTANPNFDAAIAELQSNGYFTAADNVSKEKQSRAVEKATKDIPDFLPAQAATPGSAAIPGTPEVTQQVTPTNLPKFGPSTPIQQRMSSLGLDGNEGNFVEAKTTPAIPATPGTPAVAATPALPVRFNNGEPATDEAIIAHNLLKSGAAPDIETATKLVALMKPPTASRGSIESQRDQWAADVLNRHPELMEWKKEYVATHNGKPPTTEEMQSKAFEVGGAADAGNLIIAYNRLKSTYGETQRESIAKDWTKFDNQQQQQIYDKTKHISKDLAPIVPMETDLDNVESIINKKGYSQLHTRIPQPGLLGLGVRSAQHLAGDADDYAPLRAAILDLSTNYLKAVSGLAASDKERASTILNNLQGGLISNEADFRAAMGELRDILESSKNNIKQGYGKDAADLYDYNNSAGTDQLLTPNGNLKFKASAKPTKKLTQSTSKEKTWNATTKKFE